MVFGCDQYRTVDLTLNNLCCLIIPVKFCQFKTRAIVSDWSPPLSFNVEPFLENYRLFNRLESLPFRWGRRKRKENWWTGHTSYWIFSSNLGITKNFLHRQSRVNWKEISTSPILLSRPQTYFYKENWVSRSSHRNAAANIPNILPRKWPLLAKNKTDDPWRERFVLCPAGSWIIWKSFHGLDLWTGSRKEQNIE